MSEKTQASALRLGRSAKRGSRSGPEEERMQGHWLLAKMGKKVLRPGGLELSHALLHRANPTSSDRIVEFGPGVGRTAQELLHVKPTSYVCVDPHPQGSTELSKVLAAYHQARLHVADAASSGLDSECADLVVTEAMLTMQSPDHKSAIVAEAARILAPGGRYAIHELAFVPDDVPKDVVSDVAKALSQTIKVGARPLTVHGWSELLQSHGLEIQWTSTMPMRLLEPSRIIADEGLYGFLRFVGNVLRNRAARRRILAMRSVFRRHRCHLAGVAILAVKTGEEVQ